MIITKILDMLDRNNPAAVQLEGMRLAEETGEIKPFIQPLTPRHSKNVWENCAIIISAKSDEELKDYLGELLEWLQDMNWPGAFRIFDRFKCFSDRNLIVHAINESIKTAKSANDEIWEQNLRLLL